MSNVIHADDRGIAGDGGYYASFGLRLACLAGMGALFFSTYGLSNWLASLRGPLPTIAFDWEHAIPFVPWTIVPYWSIDLLYALSFGLCTKRQELFDHVKRLLIVQMISVACFMLWPLSFGGQRPDTSGVMGELFSLLAGFDKPYNQAPSLHIGLLVVLWAFYAEKSRTAMSRGFLHLWFAGIGVSVLTTWQHHFFDVPTGAAVGCLALFLFPLRNEPYGSALADSKPSARSRQIAFWYAIGASAAAISTLLLMRWSAAFALCTGWIALATACVAWAYWRGGPYAFQKNDRGQIPLAVRLLLAPVIAGAFVNSRIWTRTQPDAVKVAPGVYVGRTPTNRDIRRHRYAANLDLTAEMPRWTRDDASFAYVCVPQLDLVPSSLSCLHEAVHALDRLHREHGDVLVSCALGLGRSVRCVAGWIAMKEGLSDAREAILMVRRAQPRAVCSEESVALLQTWIDSTRALEV